MENRILFIVINDEIKFLQNSTMDHREWYLSLGGDINKYDDVIRGYIYKGKIIFFKANLNYDKEVIDFATRMGIPIRNQIKEPTYKICCGINPGKDGADWEPIMTINDEELIGYKSPEELEREKQIAEQKKKQEELGTVEGPIIEFRNDTTSPEFIKYATTFTIILIVLAILSKIIFKATGTIITSNRWISLLIFIQIGGFIFTIVGYKKKIPQTKYIAFASAVASIFLFDIIDIIIGILNALFTVDHTYIVKLLQAIEKLFSKLKKPKS